MSVSQAALLAKQAYGNALTRINQGRQQTLRQYGYQADFDENTGVANNLRVDPSNPYGAYQTMLRSHSDDFYGERDDLIGRGISGGLRNAAMSKLRQRFGGDAAALGTSLTGTLAGFQGEQNEAKYDMDRSIYEAQLQAAMMEAGEMDFGDFGGDGGYYDDPSMAGHPMDYWDGNGPPPLKAGESYDLGDGSQITADAVGGFSITTPDAKERWTAESNRHAAQQKAAAARKAKLAKQAATKRAVATRKAAAAKKVAPKRPAPKKAAPKRPAPKKAPPKRKPAPKRRRR